MRYPTIKGFVTLITLLFLLMITGCGNASSDETASKQNTNDTNSNEDVTHIRLAGTLPVSHHISKALEDYVGLINEKGEGKIDAVYYPSGQLFEDNAILEAIPSGTVEMAQINYDKWSGVVPSSEIFSIPGLYTEFEQIHEALDSEIGELLREDMQEIGVEPMVWLDFGLAYLASTDEPINNKESFKNKKIRSTGTLSLEFVEDMGASPASVSGAEVTEALSTGVIDAAFSGVTSFASRKYYDFTDYFTGPFFSFPHILVANKEWYDSLPGDIQDILKESAEEVMHSVRQAATEEEQKATEESEANGLQYVEPTEDDIQLWYSESENAINNWLNRSGERGEELLEKSKELLGKE